MCVSRSAALQPSALYISAATDYNTIWSQKILLFLLHLCAFGKKNAFVTYCSAATYRLIHFRSCQMGHGPCPAVTLHPTSYCTVTLSVLCCTVTLSVLYCTVTLSVLCHSNEVLLCHKCTIPVQMWSQRAAVPLLVCQLLQDWKRVRPSKLHMSWEQFTVHKYQVLSHGWQWHFWCRLKQRDIALLLQPAGLDNALWAKLTLFIIKRKEARGKM